MAFDKSKYVNRVIKQEAEEIKTVSNPDSGGGNDWVKTIFPNKLPDGDYIMNIMPPHNPELGYWQQCSTTTMHVMGKDKDGNEKATIKPVFSGEAHSKTGRCIIKEYIDIADKMIKADETDALKIQGKMDTLYGEKYNPSNKNPKYGILPKSSYAYYVEFTATNGGKLPDGDGVYKLMANRTIKNAIEEIEIKNQEVDQPLKTDIYTDPESGSTLILSVDSKQPGKDKYGITLRAKRIAVKDASYDKWDSQTPLADLYVDSYTEKDFNLAIEGLENFDKESGFGLFATEEFLDICEKLSSLYPAAKVKEEKAKAPTEAKAKEAQPQLEESELPWEKEDAAKMVDHGTTATAPSATMSDEEKAKKLADLKARLVSN
jgi:hypothetical protein